MKQDLDEMVSRLIEYYTKRFQTIYYHRMEKTKDKEFAYTQFALRMVLFNHLRRETSGNYPHQIETMCDHYKLGQPFCLAIKKLRGLHKNIDFQALEGSLQPFRNSIIETSLPYETKVTRFSDANNLSDEELAILFAQYQSYNEFTLFLGEEATQFLPEGSETPANLGEALQHISDNKNKEFTTGRQVLAIHFLLQFCQVRNIDQTEKARFIQFLTGKNYDNIYKKVTDPLSGSDKNRLNDLKYIRVFFEHLKMYEVVKMIVNEMHRIK